MEEQWNQDRLRRGDRAVLAEMAHYVKDKISEAGSSGRGSNLPFAAALLPDLEIGSEPAVIDGCGLHAQCRESLGDLAATMMMTYGARRVCSIVEFLEDGQYGVLVMMMNCSGEAGGMVMQYRPAVDGSLALSRPIAVEIGSLPLKN